MIAFGWVINITQRGVASWGRMREIFDAPAESDFTPGVTAISPASATRGTPPRLEFRHLTFAYAGATTPVLEDVSFTVEPGQTVGIVGATGSGKSTLLALLPRLHEPPHGTVFLDGVDIRDLPLPLIRRLMGVAPQEPFLFSDTIAANVAFGLDAIDDAAVRADRVTRAGTIAGLAQDIDAFPKGYETMVGERGITLSGGQKQRTALARAIALEPSMLLLDDALSSVDTATEEAILRQLTESAARACHHRAPHFHGEGCRLDSRAARRPGHSSACSRRPRRGGQRARRCIEDNNSRRDRGELIPYAG